MCCRSQGSQASGRKRRLRFQKRPGFLRHNCSLFRWFLLHGNMGPTSKDATTNCLGDYKPKNLCATWLWQAWVAWIERGQQILGREYLLRKIIRIHHWFTTQTSTLTMFELDCDSQLNNSPVPTLWSLHELNVFARKNSGNLAAMDSLDRLTVA